MAIDRNKKTGKWEESKHSGPPKWLRILSPISNLASLKKGGKLPEKKRKSQRKSKRKSSRRY